MSDRWMSYWLYVLWLRLWYPYIIPDRADRDQAQRVFDACQRAIAAKEAERE